MKKLFLSLALFAFGGVVMAEGYQVNMQSAKQTGMGHVGVAMKLGSESMHFNPAGMAFMKNSIDLSVGASAVFANVKYSNGGMTAKTDNSPSTPMFVYAGFKISDKFSAGISMNNPYGSGLDWGKNWVGADLVQDISLKSFNIQPTLSYKILDNLSIGAGAMMYFGNVDISRALLPAGTLTAMGMGPQYKDVIPVSATLSGDAGLRVGYNIGAMWDATDRLTIGASYRSYVKLKVNEGLAQLDYASEAIKMALSSKIPPLDMGTFRAEMPAPANLNIGAAYKFTDRLLLSAEIQTVFWSAYDKLDIIFSEEVLGGYNISSNKDYRNTIIARVGGEYNLTKRLDIRAGLYFDQTPVNTDYLNPETPGMNKIGISAGFSFRPVEKLSIDFAFLYIQGIGRDGSVSYKNGLLQDKIFSGHYSSIAFAPSLGLSYKF